MGKITQVGGAIAKRHVPPVKVQVDPMDSLEAMTVRLREDLADLPAYVPGKTVPGAVKLASNEVTFGPLPSVRDAIVASASAANRYPDNGAVDLTEALAKAMGVAPENVQPGCGSVTLCRDLITITSAPGDEVLFAECSFEAYPLLTHAVGATPVTVPLTNDYVHDLTAMAAAVTDRTRLIFVCNPNNPTGTVVDAHALRAFLQQVPSDIVVALDEAYVEYTRPSDQQRYDVIDLLREHANLVVLRTFSKAYGLAGLRVGYAVGAPTIIQALRKVHIPFSVNAVAQAAAIASLDAADELLLRTDSVVAQREQVRSELEALGYDVPASHANFVWIALGDKAADFAAWCAQSRVIVRPFAGQGVRVTVTEGDENEHFLAAARTFRGE